MKLALLLLVSASAMLPQAVPANSVPRILRLAEPEYTNEALAVKIEGTVTLEAVVGTDGSLSNIKVAKFLGKGLDEKAVECVQKWRFKAATRNGEPIAMKATIEVNFRLDGLHGSPVTIRFAEDSR